MLVAVPGIALVCHCWPFQLVTAGRPAGDREKTSWPAEPDPSRSVVAASAVPAVVPGSSRTTQVPPLPVASASVPCASAKNTLVWSAPVVIAASGLSAATPYGDGIELEPLPEATVSTPDAAR